MFYKLNWFLVLGLLALWSLGVWAFHALTVWVVSQTGAWSGPASVVQEFRWPEGLAPWLPTETELVFASLLSGLVPVVDGLLHAMPALAGGLSVVTWVIWGFGCVLLVLMGAGLHLLMAMRQRRMDGNSDHPHRPW